jgi:hypothetical protein
MSPGSNHSTRVIGKKKFVVVDLIKPRFIIVLIVVVKVFF